MDHLTPRGVRYDLVDTLHVHWQDMYRPERVWREFVTIPPKEGEEIYIYKKRVGVPASAVHEGTTKSVRR